MSKTRRQRASKKYKGGTEQDKIRIKKLHKENEEMYKKFSGIMEGFTEVNQKMKEKHTNKEFKEKPLILPTPSIPKDGIVLAAAVPIHIINEFENNKITVENEKMKKQRDDLFKTVDTNEDLKQRLSSIVEKMGIIQKKIGLLDDILNMDQVNVDTLQDAIKDVDTDAESLILDLKSAIPLKDIKTPYSNIESKIQNKLDIEKGVFKIESGGVKTVMGKLIDTLKTKLEELITKAENEKKTISESMSSIKNNTEELKKTDPQYKKYYEMLDILHHTPAEIELGYKKEKENIAWLNGDAKQLIELKKLVENNNVLLKKITGELERTKIAEKIDSIKDEVKDDEDEKPSDVILIETYPFAQEVLNKKPSSGHILRVIVKNKGKGTKRRIKKMDSDLFLLKNIKRIKEWEKLDQKNARVLKNGMIV